jgi:hypothetical protein
MAQTRPTAHYGYQHAGHAEPYHRTHTPSANATGSTKIHSWHPPARKTTESADPSKSVLDTRPIWCQIRYPMSSLSAGRENALTRR